MKLISLVLLVLMVFGTPVSAEPMGLDKSEEIMASGRVIKVDKQILEDGKVTLDFWYVAFEESLFYCVTNRGTQLYIECYDKKSLE